MTVPLDPEKEHWEAILSTEGMAPLPCWVPHWSRGGCLDPHLVDTATEQIEWASGDDGVAQDKARERLAPLVYWLPPKDHETLAVALRGEADGLTQRQMGKALGISQSGLSTRLTAVKSRLTALGRLQTRGTLPRDREHLHELALAAWERQAAGRQWTPGLGRAVLTHPPEIRADLVVEFSRMWNLSHAAKAVGVTQSVAWHWLSVLPPGAVRDLVEVIRAGRVLYGRPGRRPR